ncbi:MAG: SPOR domain-containing protein [Treponema sp.]|nr:SPOR domain-containing protein [Candidatus Treponema equifaecale]
MKKLSVFILTIFTMATLFAVARPSLDGRAVVAESGTMPKGLFARTVGYLPGDSVTVTNPATGSTTDILVLGAIDPSEGVAILLSPEAAEALRIQPNSNVQVKLTKRSGSLDENATGSAVLSNEEDESAAMDSVSGSEIAAEPESNENEIAENTENIEIPADSTESAASEENTEIAEEVPAENAESEGSASDESYVEEVVAAEDSEEELAAEAVSVENAEVVELPAEPEPETNTAELLVETAEEEIPAVAEVVESENLQPVILVQEEPPAPFVEEPLDPVEESLPALVEDKVSENLQPVIVVEEEIPPAVIDSPAKKAEGTEVSEESTVETAVEEIPAYAEKEPEVTVEAPAEEESEDPFSPIVLVPTEPNPPAQTEKAEPVQDVAPVVEAPVAAKVVEPVVEPKPEPKVEKPVVTNDWTNYIVPSHSNLRSGSYYIQIASLGNVDNIKNIINKYSSKYPVVLIQSTNGKTYQVLVGPLNIDEYGSVLAKFKAWGYKDAFVKRIK